MTSLSFAIPNSAQPVSPYSRIGATFAGPVRSHESIADTCSESAPLVFVVGDEPCARESLEQLVGTAGWRAECFSCATEFLARPLTSSPACLVLDVSLPDMHGLDLQKRLAAHASCLPILMVGSSSDVPTAVSAMKAGAIDFMTKPVDVETLVVAVKRAIERSHAALREEAEARTLQQRYATLTRREREVMERVVVGRLNKQVAGDLDISEITVKAHRGRMMQKMKARSLPDLVRMAARLRLAG
jgi:FixJ family two-component response regulator